MDETWGKLRKNIVEIQNHNAANLSFEENHRYAYNMVLHKNGERLYKGTTQLIADNLDKLANQFIIPAFPTNVSNDPLQKSQEGEMLLKSVKKVWDDHTSSLSKLRDVLRYMVRGLRDLLSRTSAEHLAPAGPRLHQERERARDLGRRPERVHQTYRPCPNPRPCHCCCPHPHPNRA